MSADITVLAIQFIQARRARDEAHAKLVAFRREHGDCKALNGSPDGPCYNRYYLPFEEWCSVCRESQPIYMTYRQLAAQVGSRLRMLTKAVPNGTTK